MIREHEGNARCLPRFLAAGIPPDEGPASKEGPRDTSRPAKRRVLVVEDEAVVAMNIETALAAAGFEVLAIVDTEKDAVAAAGRLKPDIVLMDITLRGGNGIAAAKSIQQQSDTQIIFLSGNSDPKTLAEAHAVEGAGFILKPFVTDRLAKLVLAALSA